MERREKVSDFKQIPLDQTGLIQFIEKWNTATTPAIIAKVNEWEARYKEDEIRKAIYLAIRANQRRIPYIDAILKNWAGGTKFQVDNA